MTFRRLFANESGATSIEYALIACGIAMAILATVDLIGLNLVAKFTQLAGLLS